MRNASERGTRDARLDVARGLCLFFIMIDHMRQNTLADWTLGQFGLSDAATVFIFVSGYTAAIAFGRTYQRAGWLIGTMRTLQRVWQLYVAQIAVVMVVAAIPGLVRHLFGAHGYVSTLQLHHLFNDPLEAFWGVVTLTYVPPYLDILPVYVVLLALVPVVMAIARVDRRIVPILSFAVWATTRLTHWNLPADPTDGRGWFFDPFSWQFLFLTAFALGMGWIVPPRRTRALDCAAVGLLGFGLLVRTDSLLTILPWLAPVHDWALGQLDKTYLDPLELLHFAALTYVVTALIDRRPALLDATWLRPFRICGQQSLPVFLGTIVTADLGGIAFDRIGIALPAQVIINALGFAALFGIGYLTAWMKSAPWKDTARPATGTVRLSPRSGEMEPAYARAGMARIFSRTLQTPPRS